ncbi:MAG: prohibitin family protein [Dehalococcoidia bacterium]|nr:prohibitin family protein [Dehalococcoidia bacterium]MSQ16478.1 prohibitin family protein [Dehalococcoidia bacterium]
MAFCQVDAGYRGVVTEFGAPTGEIKGEGIYMIIPFVQQVHDMSLQVDKHDAPSGAASKDLQEVHTTVTVNFHLNADSVIEIYRTLRRDYEERIIVPAVQETVKATTAHFVAEELITERPRVKLELETQLTSRLAPYGIIVDAVSLTDFEFSAAFTVAIESKQVAVQRAMEEENLLRQI